MDKIIIINKPIGFTSQDVVSKVKKILNEKKAGHTGTLDPMATGVLPVLIGNTTKLSKYLVEHSKEYIAVVKLGIETDTLDQEGTITKQEEVDKAILGEDNIKNACLKFIGTITQTPPKYSAIKVNGKKLYEYARDNIDVEIPTRQVEISSIQVLDIMPEENQFKIKVECSKGTYIRTLCSDLAKELGTIGYMSSLIRIKVDKFKIDDAISFEELESNSQNTDWLESHTYTMESVMANLPKYDLNQAKYDLFINGTQITCNLADGVYNIYCNNNYLGLGIAKAGLIKRDVII